MPGAIESEGQLDRPVSQIQAAHPEVRPTTKRLLDSLQTSLLTLISDHARLRPTLSIFLSRVCRYNSKRRPNVFEA
jgi:hypothetical protein